MSKNILLVGALALIIFGAIGLARMLVDEPVELPPIVNNDPNDAVQDEDETSDNDNDTATTTGLSIATPQSGETVSSPLVIAGKAIGPWYFEASFSARLEDSAGTELGIAILQAQGEWMTTDYVPFVGTMQFSQPTTATGTLIFEKANPSGLPEHGAEVRVPVRFEAGAVAE